MSKSLKRSLMRQSTAPRRRSPRGTPAPRRRSPMLETVPASDLTSVGHKTRRVDSIEKLTGEATYVSDMVLPGMLYARVKTSPHARARIISIDTSAAEAMTGVRAVITGHDIGYKLGLYVVDKDILARNEVRHFGEGVAAVAADTLEIAQKAV